MTAAGSGFSWLCLLFLAVLWLNLLSISVGQSPACVNGFQSFTARDGDDRRRRRRRGSDQTRHRIVPFLTFECPGTVNEVQFGASYAEDERGTVVFEIWRPIGTSSGIVTKFSSVTGVTYTGSSDDDGIRSTTVDAAMSVASGDVIGYYLDNTRSLDIATSNTNDDFTIFQLKGDSASNSIANIPSYYDSSSGYSPLISVSFVTPEGMETTSMTSDAVSSTSMIASLSDETSSEGMPGEGGTASVLSSSSLVVEVSSPVMTLSSEVASSSEMTSSSITSASPVAEASSSELKSSSAITTSPEIASSSDVPGSSPVADGTSGLSDGQGGNFNGQAGSVEPGVIVGAVLGAVVLVVIAIVVAGCVVFAFYPKESKKKVYVALARYRKDTARVELTRARLSPTSLTASLTSRVLAEYDDPEAYSGAFPYQAPVDFPPLPPSNDIKQEVYEVVTVHSSSGGEVLANPVAVGTDGYDQVVRQEDPVSGVVLTAAGQTVLYDTITDGGQPMAVIYEHIGCDYGFVPNEVSRREGTLSRRCTGLEQELQSIYQGVTKREFENVPFTPPAEKLTTLYEQLAEKKCIEIPRAHLKKEKVLGNGEFGDVYKGVWETPYGPQDVAMKMLKKNSSEKDKISFLKEAALMGQFRHPHVIRLLGTVTLEEPCIIVLEFLPKKDLEVYLCSQRPEPGVLPESSLPSQLLKFCRQIADGMKYLTSKGFIHRDLATRNVLLDKNLKCKIADFGLSKTVGLESEYYVVTSGKIPVRWTAPEALHYKKYTTSSDVWSFGMVMFEIWSLGEKPFAKLDVRSVVRKLQKEPTYVQPPPPGCPRDMYRLMVFCWDRNHHSRPSFASILGVLNGSSEFLLVVPVEDLERANDPQKAAQLGMPLECAEQLYSDLQMYYLNA